QAQARRGAAPRTRHRAALRRAAQGGWRAACGHVPDLPEDQVRGRHRPHLQLLRHPVLRPLRRQGVPALFQGHLGLHPLPQEAGTAHQDRTVGPQLPAHAAGSGRSGRVRGSGPEARTSPLGRKGQLHGARGASGPHATGARRKPTEDRQSPRQRDRRRRRRRRRRSRTEATVLLPRPALSRPPPLRL
ncbi:unnamed protein product, partial [Ixodes persulcatus]